MKRPATGPLAAKNRRAEKRCPAALVSCQVLHPAQSWVEAEVVNLTARGMCLLLTSTVVAGDVLLVRLSNRQHLCLHEVALRLTHSRGRPGVCCLAGGEFAIELPAEVFRSLLA